jgi:RNA polymerase sigma-70 factor (ECF subfamily)
LSRHEAYLRDGSEGAAQYVGVNETRAGSRAEPVPLDFHAVYDAEFGYVFRSLRRLGIMDHDIEDLAHDVFLAVYRRWAEYDPARAVRPWLFGFAYRIASDHRRLSRHRHEKSGVPTEAVDGAQLADEQLAAEQTRSAVLAALDTMDFDRRAILVMHDVDGHPVPEIARALLIPLNTAYSRLRLARRDFEFAIRRGSAKEGAP